MSLLANIVLGGELRDEPVATQALAYILNSSPDIAQRFIRELGRAGINFEPGRILYEREPDDNRPDLTIRDTEGHLRVFVENKFWAGLTDRQPVSYLNALPENLQTALIFIVPEQRVSFLWNKLKERCVQESLDLTDDSNESGITWTCAGSRTLLITSWPHVLSVLQGEAARTSGHNTIECDILQLRGLTDQIDWDAFPPLREDEVNDQRIAQRIINYIDLIEEISNKLINEGIADSKRLKWVSKTYSSGRYLRVYERFGLWLGVDLKVWRKSGITPLWWRTDYNEFSGVMERWSQFKNLFDDVQEYNENLYIPIYLKTGVERDKIIDDCVSQIRLIARRVLDHFPDE